MDGCLRWSMGALHNYDFTGRSAAGFSWSSQDQGCEREQQMLVPQVGQTRENVSHHDEMQPNDMVPEMVPGYGTDQDQV